MPTFEFDAEKGAANLAKHGIDFVGAQLIWQDRDAVVIAARSETEQRFARVGLIADKFWSVFFTPRNGAIRIFSARRSRLSEVRLYGSKIHQR